MIQCLLNHPVNVEEINEEHMICEQYKKSCKTLYLIITTSVQWRI